MRPLAVFRNNLKAWRERPELRSKKRRNEQLGPGPFTLAARQMILEELFETERQVPGRTLISDEGIQEIQRLWTKDGDGASSAPRLAVH